MDSRRHFLRGLARAATGGARPPEAPQPTPDPSLETAEAPDEAPAELPADRYAAARAHPEWGRAAQQALERASVLVIGAGALGTPVLGYLAGAGVGRLGVLDDAAVALTDLHAATIHFTPDVGVPKAHSAAAKLAYLNPAVVVEPYQVHLDAENVDGLVAGQDLVVDCSNSDATSAVVAESCARLGVALTAAGLGAHGGWVFSVPAGERACRACAGVEPASASDRSGGPAAGAIGSLSAGEALRRVAGVDAPPPATVLELDLAAPRLRRSPLTRRPNCPVCGAR